jgi:hypothetical protein
MPSIKLDATLIWDVAKAVVPIIISAAALFFVLKDRHPKLEIRAKFGDWYKLRVTLTGAEIMFQGVIEVYNRSSRANAVRGYGFEYMDPDGKWKSMESEQYTNKEPSSSEGAEEVLNRTALTIAPYSAIESWVQALAKMPRPKDGMQVRIRIEDLFGKRLWVS